MKKYFYLTAIAALSLAACTKEAKISDEAAQDQTENAYNFYFTATAPGNEKTTLDDTTGAVEWEEGDVIDIWYLNSGNTPVKVTGTALSAGPSTSFGATLPAGDDPDHFWAAYPAGSGTLTNEGGESFTITVGTTDGSFKKANIMAAYSTATAKSFAFKNAVGIVRLQIPAGGVISHGGKDYTISTIRLKGKEVSIRSRGDAVVNIEGGAVSGFTFPTSGGAQSAQVALTDAVRASGYVYIPSYPGTLTNGFAVRYFSEEGNIPAVLTKDTPVTITAGNIKPLSDLTPRIVWDYYVSASGSGDGLTAATPMSVADMESMFTHGGESSVIMCYSNLINGTTFHFTPGTHIITAPINLPAQTIYSEATYYTITGDNEATLNGGGSSRIFEITNACDRVSVTDMTLTNGSKSVSGSLLLISNASPIFKNCTFTTSETSEVGGGVRVDTANKGNASFENCSFSNIKSTGNHGGVLVITNAGTHASFKNCLFTDNSASNNGGVIYGTNGIVEMDNCTLGTEGHGNTAVGGGAIYVTGSPIFKLNQCDISYNQGTSAAGGIYTTGSNKPVIYLNACKFVDNETTSNGYAIYLNTSTTDKEASLCANNCYFYHSTTLNTSGKNQAIVCNKGKTIVMNSTLIGTFGSNAWGPFALGCHTVFSDPNGCLLINDIIKNKASQYQTSVYETGGNYYAVIKHCLARVVHKSSSGFESQIVQDNVASDASVSFSGYTWNGTTPSGFVKKSAQEIKDELLSESAGTPVYSLAADFYSWLEGLTFNVGGTEYDAFQVDINGNPRSESSYWPGCYQN